MKLSIYYWSLVGIGLFRNKKFNQTFDWFNFIFGRHTEIRNLIWYSRNEKQHREIEGENRKWIRIQSGLYITWHIPIYHPDYLEYDFKWKLMRFLNRDHVDLDKLYACFMSETCKKHLTNFQMQTKHSIFISFFSFQSFRLGFYRARLFIKNSKHVSSDIMYYLMMFNVQHARTVRWFVGPSALEQWNSNRRKKKKWPKSAQRTDNLLCFRVYFHCLLRITYIVLGTVNNSTLCCIWCGSGLSSQLKWTKWFNNNVFPRTSSIVYIGRWTSEFW